MRILASSTNPVFDRADLRDADTKLRCQVSQFHVRAFCESTSQFVDFCIGQFRGAVALAYCHAPLIGRVPCVVAWGANKQVVWPNAARDITSVTDKHPWWNWAVRQFVRVPVRSVVTSRPRRKELAIAIRPNPTAPQPARIAFVDVTPEARNWIGLSHHALILSQMEDR
jgi:hypothetical protein